MNLINTVTNVPTAETSHLYPNNTVYNADHIKKPTVHRCHAATAGDTIT